MPQHLPSFLSGQTYHVYNHANGSDNIFREEDNYRFFEERYKKYMGEVVDTLAYCWMKNHFHLMVRVKDADYFRSCYSKTSKVSENLGGLDDEEAFNSKVSKIISQNFSNLFNSYTKAFNKKYDRIGSLFAPNIKRKPIASNSYFTSCIIYIHQNPVLHGFVDDLFHWKRSSYLGIVEENDPLVRIDEVLDWFGGKDQFVETHKIYRSIRSEFE